MNVWEFSVPPCILYILLLFCLLYLSLLFSLFFFWTELSWKLIKNVYLNRGPNKLMLQCPSLLHQMYMLFINWMYFICDNKLCWTWTWTCWTWKQTDTFTWNQTNTKLTYTKSNNHPRQEIHKMHRCQRMERCTNRNQKKKMHQKFQKRN